VLAGIAGLVGRVGVCGLWAVRTVISGAVSTPGQAVVRGKPQQVQHLDGGIVAEIAVQNGDLVAAGDLLLRLDPTLLELNLNIALRRLADALTLQARLEAEQSGAETLRFTYPDLPFELPDTRAEEAGQRQIFAARQAVLNGMQDQLAEALAQIDNQIRGQQAQIAALRDQLALQETDIANMRTLTDRNLARQSQLNDLQRGRSEILGRLAGLEAEVAQLTNARRDSALQTMQTLRSFHEEVVTELRETASQRDQLILDIVTRMAQMERIEIRAPQAGVVHELQVSTVGGVVTPGAVLAQIIPQEQGLDFELRVNPRDIDQVYIGQTGEAMIASFDPRSIPKLLGTVTQISPDVIEDRQTGESFYRITLDVSQEERARLGGVQIIPGMPVEGYLQTGDRTVLNYLVSPLTDQLRRAFREG